MSPEDLGSLKQLIAIGARLRENELQIALEVINKQIPKEPIFTTDGDYDCPVCSGEVSMHTFDCSGVTEHYHDYCPNCGQKIDWSEE